MANILDALSQGWGMGQRMAEDKRRKTLASLFQQGYSAPRDQRQQVIGQVAGLDPQAAMQMEDQFSQMDDRRTKELVASARLLVSLPEEQRPAAYASLRPRLSAAIPEMQLPEQYDQQVAQTAQALVEAWGGGAGDELKSLRIGANGNYWAIRGGQFVDTGVPAAPDVQIIDAGAAGHYGVNKRTLGATPVRVGAGTAAPAQSLPPQAGEPTAMSPDVVTAAANRMAKAGVPPEEIDAWVVQATGGAWSDSQPQTAPASADPILRKVPQISPAEQQRLAFEAERLDLERQRAANEMGPPKPAELAKDEMGIRKELEGRTREYQQVLDAYRRVEAAASSPTAASDLSLIFGYMKMLDPGSVVREGEFANAQNTAGIPDRVRNLYNRALSGERLNPQQRQEFLAEARKLRDIAQAEKGKLEMQYGELAEQYGFDPVRATGSRLATPEARQRQQQAEQMLREARQAISRGADREAVKQRLIQMGFPNTASRL